MRCSRKRRHYNISIFSLQRSSLPNIHMKSNFAWFSPQMNLRWERMIPRGVHVMLFWFDIWKVRTFFGSFTEDLFAIEGNQEIGTVSYIVNMLPRNRVGFSTYGESDRRLIQMLSVRMSLSLSKFMKTVVNDTRNSTMRTYCFFVMRINYDIKRANVCSVTKQFSESGIDCTFNRINLQR